MSISDIKNMPLQERMQLMEALWESFVQNGDTQSPIWHEGILENRARHIQERPVKTYTIEELKKQR